MKKGIFHFSIALLFCVNSLSNFVIGQSPAIPSGNSSAMEMAEEAERLRKAGNIALSIELYTRAIGQDPKFVMSYFGRSLAYDAKGEKEKAIADLTQAISLKGDVSIFFSNRGDLYFSQNEFPQSLADMNKAIELDANNPGALFTRGILLFYREQCKESEADQTKFIGLAPTFPGGYFERGRARICLKKPAEALLDFQKAIDLAPEVSIARTYKARALKDLDRKSDAIAELDIVLKSKPDDLEALVNRGDLLSDLKDYKGANRDLQRAYALDSKDSYIMVLLSVLHFRLENTEELLRYADLSIAVEPNRGMAHNNRAYALILLGRYDEAKGSISNALKYEPGLALAHNNRALLNILLGKYGEAKKDLDAVEKAAPELSYLHYNQALLELRKKRLDSALVRVNKAIELEPDLRIAYALRSEIYAGLKRPSESAADKLKSENMLAEKRQVVLSLKR